MMFFTFYTLQLAYKGNVSTKTTYVMSHALVFIEECDCVKKKENEINSAVLNLKILQIRKE